MAYRRILRNGLSVGVIWAVLALASMVLRDGAGAVLLLWLPSGLAVAAFFALRRRAWPLLCAVLLPVQTLALVLGGLPLLEAFVNSVATEVQAMVCAAIGIAVLGNHNRAPREFAQVLGLFGAAVAGSVASALVAMPFRAVQTAEEAAWWFLANVLGIIIFAPIVLTMHKHIRRGGKILRAQLLIAAGWIAVCATLALLAVAWSSALLPLLFAAMVLVTVRYGQLATLLCVLAYAAVPTSLSLGGENPLPVLALDQNEARFVVQSWLLGMLAAALPIAAVLLKGDKLQLDLIERNHQMHDSLMILDLAEQLAGIGRWRLDLLTGGQDWSPRMLELNGLEPGLAPDPGDVRALLPDGGVHLFSKIASRRDETSPFEFDYEVQPQSGQPRILRMSVLNEFDQSGRRIAVFAVAMDVTPQIRREQALDQARGRAMRLAAEAQKLANTDPLTNLPNRRCTFARLATMVEVAHRRSRALSAVMFDIDHFKAINDGFGHQTGDEVIALVAELARRQARSGDLVGRIGGEEYVWLLPDNDEQTAHKMAERLRQSVEDGLEGSSLPQVTISIGVASYRAGDTGDTLLARADAALYAAKQGGRNRVRMAA